MRHRPTIAYGYVNDSLIVRLIIRGMYCHFATLLKATAVFSKTLTSDDNKTAAN